jgi:hypothetical protein
MLQGTNPRVRISLFVGFVSPEALYNFRATLFFRMQYTQLMRGSVIIFGSTLKARQQMTADLVEKELGQKTNFNYLANFPDIKVIEIPEDRKSIGIALAKEGADFLQERPLVLPFKALIISSAETMTDEAQNSLLKTLEEPPSYALILLISKTESGLLETVQSRCRKIKAGVEILNAIDGEQPKQRITLAKILSMSVGERLDWAEEYAKEEREDIVETLEKWVEECHRTITESNSAVNAQVILSAHKDLENTGLGIRLILENLVIQLK